MKLHELRPAPGSRKERTRVGRGIAAGRGKTAGRGTKGQKARTGSSSRAWFEGGQTPLHMRVPKLRGFKNRFRVEYAVVNVGRIEAALAEGRLEPGPRDAPATVNAELLFVAGLVGRLNLPLKILGGGEIGHPVLAVADAFSATARRKIEAAGGTVMTLEVPTAPAPEPTGEVPTEPTGELPTEPSGEVPTEPAEAQAPPKVRQRASRPAPPPESAEPTAQSQPAETPAPPESVVETPARSARAPRRSRQGGSAAEQAGEAG